MKSHFLKKLIPAITYCFMAFAITSAAYANEIPDEPDYVIGRPLTEAEIAKQKSYEPDNLTTYHDNLMRIPDNAEYYVSSPSSGYAAYYNSADLGLVTPVKDQGISEWCWSYATVSAMETSLIKNKIKVNDAVATADNIDLSEGALAYFLYNRNIVADPMHLTVNDYNSIRPANEYLGILGYSGNNYFLAEFLMTSMGIKNEDYYTYDDALNELAPDVSKAYKDNVALVRDVRYVNNSINSMKSAIQSYGSITATLDWNYDGTYFNYDTAAYSNPDGNPNGNHSINIVGWDDSYSYNNFNSISNVNKNGAWIVKNSWGDYWGDNGYFYLSYYDSTVTPYTAIRMQAATAYDNTYFYDGTSSNSYVYLDNDSSAGNIFISSGRQKLKQVNCQFLSRNTNYSIQIYKNIKNSSNPTSGTAVLEKPITGKATAAGIYTFNVPDDIYLDKNERFSVVVTVKSPDYCVLLGSESSYDYEWFESKASFSKNQSFIKYPGNNKWEDASETEQCIRIKAYTDDSNVKKVTFKDSSGIISSQYVDTGKSASLSSIKKRGYSIESTIGNYQNITKDSTVTVIWRANKYKVAFNANKGSINTSSKLVTFNSKYGTLPNPKRKGYKFIGWYTNTSYTTKITSNSKCNRVGKITLYAKWKKVSVSKGIINNIRSPRASCIRINIKKISNANAYEIKYSTNSSMKKSKTILTKSTGKTLKGLKRNKTYYVQVRAYQRDSIGNKIYGKYSNIKKVRVR